MLNSKTRGGKRTGKVALLCVISPVLVANRVQRSLLAVLGCEILWSVHVIMVSGLVGVVGRVEFTKPGESQCELNTQQ